MRIGDQRHALAALPPGMTRYPTYRRLGGPKACLNVHGKFRPPIQHLVSCYTDYAILACCITLYSVSKLHFTYILI
jgi:hypothetical protein